MPYNLLLDPHVAAVLRTLADRQEELNGKIDNVNLMLNRIYRKLAPEEEKVIRPKNLPALPLSNEDSFLEIQTFLMSDDNFYPVVSTYITRDKYDIDFSVHYIKFLCVCY